MGLAAQLAHAEETFPLPEELQPDVDFWVSIFTRYGTDEGVLHDNRNRAVVYERIGMPRGISRKERTRRIQKRREALVRILQAGLGNLQSLGNRLQRVALADDPLFQR